MSPELGFDSGMASEVAKLAQIIGQADTRQSFKSDMDGTLATAGVRRDRLPPQALDTLNGMTIEELQLLAGISQRFIDAGLSIDVPVETQRYRVMFF
ncbi:MAG: hypothetical protein ACRDGU_00865 [Actinomycetota bacterium]